jgi:hypothetical protein
MTEHSKRAKHIDFAIANGACNLPTHVVDISPLD